MAKGKNNFQQILDTKKIAIYIRVSTQHQIDRASLPVQREELINYARYALGISDYEIFQDAGYSAKNTDRPDYQSMMARVRTGEFTHVLVWKIDRISRNLLDFAAMYKELKELGVIFVSKNEQFDTSSAMGEAMLKIILVFAELERNMTSERVSAVMVSRANSGMWNGGKIPFGYSWDKIAKEFSITEDEAAVIRLIYDLYEAHWSLVTVAKILNERGILPRSGKPWNPTTVRTMLVNPFYSGTYQYNRHNENDPKRFTLKPESEWVIIEDHHPAIIDKERQDRIIKKLRSRQRGQYGMYSTYNRKNTHIFAGMLTCGCCGSNMASTIDRPRSDGWRPSVYICCRRRRFNDCQNKYISDITIGPFVLNYITNIIKASNSFGKTTSIDTLQKKLLRGDLFADIDHIGQSGLEELYNHLRDGVGLLEYKSQPVDAAESLSAISEKDLLLSEKRRLERALNRLKTLYLYGEDTMAEKDYIIERKNIADSLEEVSARLELVEKTAADAISLSDDEFMAKAHYFLMAQQLQDKRYIDYEKFIRKIDPQIVKDFINSVIQNFCIKDGRIVSILFKNGIEHQFFYKD